MIVFISEKYAYIIIDISRLLIDRNFKNIQRNESYQTQSIGCLWERMMRSLRKGTEESKVGVFMA